ncbi:hypothetical protein H072_9752 [Dactylellina haptotyla CBS 200.50]|uniref:DUF1996 domain-containing protein n=1 Tax=Dactylellina haptotyla (strain CBS 200.50) TaxID=1284197 RepID=S8BBV5_DACHA|nr:hypothetical protein H072_9752 [Dactylellina haptotyla CBS 200.50]
MKVSTFVAALASAGAFSLTEAAKSRKPGRTFGTLTFGGGKELTRCRLDPIVNPGGVAGHMHSIFGGNAFSASMPGDAATKATCTTANVKNDHSNYWVPSLYFKSPENGTLYPVELFYAKVYYFFEATNDYIKPFPKGFRMLAGDPSLRHPPSPVHGNLDSSKGAITPVQWTCPRDSADDNVPLYPPTSDGTKGVGVQDPNNGGQGWGFPDKECNGYASPMRADIHFPSCVNPNVNPEDYKQNTAYPSSNGMGGEDCPPGWLHVPHVFMEVYWNTLKFENMWEKGTGKQPWVLSNGDTTGYSLHADFINGWDDATLAYLIDNCDPAHAGLASCPGLPGGETSEDEMKACKLTCPLPEGSSDGWWQPMPNNKLFGNNPLSGYQAAAYAAPGGSGSTPPAASSVKVETAPTTSAAPVVKPPTNKPSTTMYVVTTKPAVDPKPATTNPAPYIPPVENNNNPGGKTTYVKTTRIHTTTKTIKVNGSTPPKTASAKPKKDCNRNRKHNRHGRKHNHKRAIAMGSY